jgi:hypothetical protein
MPTPDATMKALRGFLLEANVSGYASGKANAWTKNKDGSTTITYDRKGWKYHDNFFGGEPYGGREVVSYKGEPLWMMVYYGAISDTERDFKGLYAFLQRALRADPKSNPFRGPRIFREGNLSYRNSWKGSLDSFHGEENITRSGKKIYYAKYLGGLVDRRKE